MLGLKFDLPTITILPIALMLDLTTIALAFFLLDDMGICEIIGLLFIDIPLFIIGTGSIGGRGRMKGNITKVQNTIVKNLRGPLGALGTLFAELIPILDILPLWTVYAYLCLADISEIPIIGRLLQPENRQRITSYPIIETEESATPDLQIEELATSAPEISSEYAEDRNGTPSI